MFDRSDHGAVLLLVECRHVDPKAIIENFRSFRIADCTQMSEVMITKLFRATCHPNNFRMSGETYPYFEELIEFCLPRRTRHRESLPPWVSSNTSNLLKRLETKERLSLENPTSYRKRDVEDLRSL